MAVPRRAIRTLNVPATRKNGVVGTPNAGSAAMAAKNQAGLASRFQARTAALSQLTHSQRASATTAVSANAKRTFRKTEPSGRHGTAAAQDPWELGRRCQPACSAPLGAEPDGLPIDTLPGRRRLTLPAMCSEP